MKGPGAARYQVVHDHLESVIHEYIKSDNATAEGVASVMALLCKYDVYQKEFRVAMSLRTLANPLLTPEARSEIISIMAREHPYWLSDWWARRKAHPSRNKTRIVVSGEWLCRFIRRGPRRLARLTGACRSFGYEIIPESADDARRALVDLVTYRASNKKSDVTDALDLLILWLTGMVGSKAA